MRLNAGDRLPHDTGAERLSDNGRYRYHDGTLDPDRGRPADRARRGLRSDAVADGVVDRVRRIVTEFAARDDSVPFGSLVRYILISSLTVGGDVPVAVTGADGRIETVAYHKLPALLLNELLKQQRVIRDQAAALASHGDALDGYARQLAALRRAVDDLRTELAEVRR